MIIGILILYDLESIHIAELISSYNSFKYINNLILYTQWAGVDPGISTPYVHKWRIDLIRLVTPKNGNGRMESRDSERIPDTAEASAWSGGRPVLVLHTPHSPGSVLFKKP